MIFKMDTIIFILMSALHIGPTVSISTQHVRAVSPRDYYRNNPLPPEKINWELGLKEATYQALIREQISDPRLKEGIYDSNIDGFQDTATPFGDIAVIARGQLYASSQGYQFVQDPYQNDCDDCHTPHRCDRQQCEPQTHQNLDNLLALWTVKRVRHRDAKFGHRYELQFTISPMSPAANPEFVARNGRFDYGIPGHVFIVKLQENGGTSHVQNSRNNFRFDKEHKSSNHKEYKILPWTPQHNNNNGDVYNTAQHNNNNGDVYNKAHHNNNNGDVYNKAQHHNNNGEVYNKPQHNNNNGDVYNKAQTENYYHHTPNSILLNTGEYFIPQKEKTTTDHVFNPGFLIGISPNGYKHIIHDIPGLVERPYLEDKYYKPQEQPKEPVKHLHHHYYIPEVTDIDYDKKEVHPTILTTTNDQRYLTSYKPTITTTDNVHKYILTTNNIPEQHTSPKQVYTQETTQAQVVPPLTTQGINFRTTLKYPESTFSQYPTIYQDVKYSPTDPNYVENTYPKTTILKVFTVPGTSPTNPTPFSPSPFYIHYSEPDPIYNNNQPPTVPAYYPQTINPTLQPTVPTYVTIQDHPRTSPHDIFNDFSHTQSTTPVSVTISSPKPKKYPDSINAQLPAPDKGTDTTVPYVSSTAVTIISQGSTGSTRSTESSIQESDEKYTESTERKATTIQEKIHVSTNSPIYVEDEKHTTIIEPERQTNKHKTTEHKTIEHETTEHETTDQKTTEHETNDQKTTKHETTEHETTDRETTIAQRKSTKNTTPYFEPTTATIYSEDNTKVTTDSTTNLNQKESDEIFVNIPKKTTKPKIVYQEEFDIFGESKKSTEKSQETTKSPTGSTKKHPDAFDEIFSDFKSSTEHTNRFLTPHTQLSINKTDALKNTRISKYLKYKRNKSNQNKFGNRISATTDRQKIEKQIEAEKVNKSENTSKIEGRSEDVERTSQSFITSISFKVNKNNRNKTATVSQPADVSQEEQTEEHQINKNNHDSTTTDRSQTFDDVAQTLVNHARIVSYLNSKSTKPTRKSYKPNYKER